VRGRVCVVHGRVAVGNKSSDQAVGRVWSSLVGRDDRVDLIGGVNAALQDSAPLYL